MKNQSGACPVKVVDVATDPNTAQVFQEYLDTTFDDTLEASIVELVRHIAAAQAELAVRIGEFDRRQIPQIQHHLSTTGWLKHNTPMSATDASGTVKTARALTHMPTVTNRALAGDVPWQSVRLLARARDRHPEAFPLHEEVFAESATYLCVKDLRRAIGHWEQQVNYDQALTDTIKRDRVRGFYHNQTYEGLWATQATFTPEGGHIIKQAVDAITNPQSLDAGELRSPAQRRADAVVDICSFYLGHNTDAVTSAGEKPHVTITIDYDVLTGRVERMPEIDGAPVTPATVRRITCDAGIVPMVLGGDSEPLDVGRRTRTIPAAIRRAIEQIHDGCAWPGCDAPLSWCDIHHRIHWADGGETCVDNLCPYCRKHHTAVHNGEQPPPEP